MFKQTLIAFSISALIACGSAPQNHQQISSKITVTKDQFKNQTWIESPRYLSRQGFTDTFPVNIRYRALSVDSEIKFIQLYVTVSATEWGFYNSAFGEDGTELTVNALDQSVDSSAAMVTVQEDFAITLSDQYLEKMAISDWKIKVYGQRKEGVFIVPVALSKAFNEKIKSL